jgi:hypothetical protein
MMGTAAASADYHLMVEKFSFPNDLERYAGGKLLAGHPSQAGQRVEARRNVAPAPPGWGVGCGANDLTPRNILLRNHGRGQGPYKAVAPVKERRK